MAGAVITQAQIRRGLKAMREAGFDGGAVEIDPDGTLRFIVGKGAETPTDEDEIERMIRERT